jgi:HD-GYP domain-containing protein (c-di-GMP phosphodiesterase class II)
MKFSHLDKYKSEGDKPQEKRPLPPPVQAPVPAEPPQAPPPAAPPPPTAPFGAAPQERPYVYPPRTPAARPKTAPPEPAFKELDAQARSVYGRLMFQSRELLSHADQPYTEQYEAVRRACLLTIETLKKNPVLLTYAGKFTEGNYYLPGHTANSTIVALAMGLNAGVAGTELELLGFCAMAHDIGMTGYAHLYSSEKPLTEKQHAEMSLHAEDGVNKLDRIVDLDYKMKARAKQVVLQVHERTDGGGYPDRAAGETIDFLSQLIGIADAFEALTHPRPWRGPVSPPEAVRQLVEKEGKGFNARAIKALLGAVSIYPPNSIVELSGGETARVIKLNKGSLTRPLVELLLNKQGAVLASGTLDLMQHPLTSIERPLTMAELDRRSPAVSEKLAAEACWNEP